MPKSWPRSAVFAFYFILCTMPLTLPALSGCMKPSRSLGLHPSQSVLRDQDKALMTDVETVLDMIEHEEWNAAEEGIEAVTRKYASIPATNTYYNLLTARCVTRGRSRKMYFVCRRDILISPEKARLSQTKTPLPAAIAAGNVLSCELRTPTIMA